MAESPGTETHTSAPSNEDIDNLVAKLKAKREEEEEEEEERQKELELEKAKNEPPIDNPVEKPHSPEDTSPESISEIIKRWINRIFPKK